MNRLNERHAFALVLLITLLLSSVSRADSKIAGATVSIYTARPKLGLAINDLENTLEFRVGASPVQNRPVAGRSIEIVQKDRSHLAFVGETTQRPARMANSNSLICRPIKST